MSAWIKTAVQPRLTFPTLTGSIVTFNSQYAGLPLKSHKIALTATQSGSGTPSPSNPRSINGWNGQNIYHSGADTSNPTIDYVAFGSTIYGGNRDARTGVLKATHGFVDLGSLSWERRSNADYYYFRNTTIINNIKGGVAYQVGDVRCSIYEAVQSAFSADFVNYKMFLWTDGKIYLRNDDYTDANDFKTAMSGINLVYELETPTTIQLPPCPIDTLEGVNNIWADTGDTTLQYSKFG